LNMESSQTPPQDNWASGAAYEPYVGRWSRRVARQLLGWLNVPAGAAWLDVGSGTGALTQTILDITAPSRVKGIDRSAGFVAYAREQMHDPRAQFDSGDAQELPVETGTYDAVVSGLMLNFVSQPATALAEMTRVAKPNGIVAVYVWDYASKMQFMRHFWNAAAALDPGAYDLDEGRRFPLGQPEPLRALFQNTGLQDVEVCGLEIDTDFRDFEDFWSPFLGGQGPAPSYVQSLHEEQRTALRDRIRMGLPFAIDGSISLVARAWAVRGRR
jgi:SAM-dependent methyltransferase